MGNDRGTLAPTEPHPAVQDALAYLNSIGSLKLNVYRGAFASCAIEGNRLGEVCVETINRLFANQPVSDRYLLGLAWAIRIMEEGDANG